MCFLLQISYLVFLGLYTHFVLTKLAPVSSISEISVYEWLVHIWVISMLVDELVQVMRCLLCEE